MKVAGVDGVGPRWVAAVLEVEGETSRFDRWEVFDDSASWKDLGVERLVVDIPIGLASAEQGRREVDDLARRELSTGRRETTRASTVYTTPVRDVVMDENLTYGSAKQEHLRLTGASFNIQAFGLFPKIRDWDVVARQHSNRVAESHPEVIAARLRGGQPAAPKKSDEGVEQRLEVLDPLLGGKSALTALESLPQAVPADDAIDALLCAVTAAAWATGAADEIPNPVPLDAEGVPMRMVLPRRHSRSAAG